MTSASPYHGEAPATNRWDDPAPEWIYRMEVSHDLPLIHLNKTPIASLLSPATHDKFLDVMRHQYARFSTLYRLSGILLLVVLMLPRTIGYWLSVPTMLMAFPVLSCSLVMSSSNILKILPRQYEFWFFTVLNAINWGCLASFYSDVRILSLVGGVLGTQSVILIDANFRTVVSGIRSTTIAAPVLLVLGIAAFFQVIDTKDQNYRVIPVAKVNVSLVDVFTNTCVTLAVFIARKGYAKRKVLITHSAELQTIRCVVFRSKLQLKHPVVQCDLRTETRTLVVEHCAEGESPRVLETRSSFGPPPTGLESQSSVITYVTPFPGYEDPADASAVAKTQATSSEHPSASDICSRQQVTLVSMQLSAIDARCVIVPRLSALDQPLSQLRTIFFYANAIIGFATTIFTLTRRPAGSQLPPTSLEYILAITALVSTLVFFLSCFVRFHRLLAASLLHNFDFLFSSVQFTLAMALVSDMVQWDFRTFGTLAWLLWFHCVLFLDALTPRVKDHLHFRKIFFLPVVGASLVGVIVIIYGFFFSNVAEYFVERTLWETQLNGKKIALRTKSLLLNRLFTVLLWNFRLIWEIAACPDAELIFIRGNLDYLTPMEMIPPLHAVVPKAAHGSRSGRRWCSRSNAVVHASH